MFLSLGGVHIHTWKVTENKHTITCFQGKCFSTIMNKSVYNKPIISMKQKNDSYRKPHTNILHLIVF